MHLLKYIYLYERDTARFLTAPGSKWQAVLKTTKLELLTNTICY